MGIEHIGSGGVCTHGNESYQFKKQNQSFQLIGVEQYVTDCDENLFYSSGKSINYLTHQLIVWYEAGKTPNDDPLDYRFPKNHHEQKFTFPASKIWGLNDFSALDYEEWVAEVKILCNQFTHSIDTKKLNIEQCGK